MRERGANRVPSFTHRVAISTKRALAVVGQDGDVIFGLGQQRYRWRHVLIVRIKRRGFQAARIGVSVELTGRTYLRGVIKMVGRHGHRRCASIVLLRTKDSAQKSVTGGRIGANTRSTRVVTTGTMVTTAEEISIDRLTKRRLACAAGCPPKPTSEGSVSTTQGRNNDGE